MSMHHPKAVVRCFNEEVIAGGDRSAFEALIAPGFINRSAPPGTPAGAESMWNTFQNILRPALAELAVTIHDQVEEGDKVTTRKTISGVHAGPLMGVKATGKQVSIDVIDIVRVKMAGMPSIGASTISHPCSPTCSKAEPGDARGGHNARRRSSVAHDLRRSISAVVRVVRLDTGTVRSAQSETLDLLQRIGSMNVTTLAEKRCVTHQTMRLVVAGLDADGLVQQEANPADRRSRLVTISHAGTAALARKRDACASQIERAIRTLLSPGERELLRAAIPILDRLAKPLE